MNIRLKRTPGVYLVGFMGAGKSTVGRLLADHLGWNFFDTDEEIEADEKMPVSEIFAAHGEAEFRRIESAMIRAHVGLIERGRPAVVALGGGAFVAQSNRDLLENNGITVWLDCPFEVVQRRVALANHRPLARDAEQFAALYQARRPVYCLANVRIPIKSDDPAEAVDAILRHPLFQ